MPEAKKMLVFHSAYTFDDLKNRGLEIYVTSKDAGEFFEKVLTVSPIASLQYPENGTREFGPPKFYYLDERNVILEGKIERFRSLHRLKFLNFVTAQFSVVLKLLFRGKLGEIDLIQADDPLFNGIYGYFFSKLLRKPLVVGVWGNPGRIRKLSGIPIMPRLFPTVHMEEKIEKFVLRRASMVITQNLENLSYVLDVGVDATKTEILPLGIGIHSDHFSASEERLDTSSDFQEFGIRDQRVIVCISRLEQIKFVDHAIRASQVLKRAKLEFKLIIIGGGREQTNLQNLAKELGVESEVVFAGNRSQEWIAGALVRSHLALAPLTGRALLETALSGCPVVAYDVDWHGEIVRTGETGALVENLNYIEMGEAALKLLQDEPTRLKMSDNIWRVAMSMAAPEAIIEKQIEIYSNLTRSSRSQA